MNADRIEQGGGSEWLTKRTTVTERVAARWLQTHPEVGVGVKDLAKTLQQSITEVFATGHQRRREALSAHAVAVLEAIDVDPVAFAPARTFSIQADMPIEYGRIFGAVAEVLAPLAAAVQLARIPVADAAEKLARERGLLVETPTTTPITRRELRGFVVARVRPLAEQVHAEIGAGQTADGYFELIMRDAHQLAERVVDAAVANAARPDVLSAQRAADLERYLTEHRDRLRHASSRYGQHAEDVLAIAECKLALAFRNPALCPDYAYGRAVVRNAGNDCLAEVAQQTAYEVHGIDDPDRFGESRDDTMPVEAADLIVHHVLTVAKSLRDDDAEGALAGEVLRTFFLTDPAVADPRKARLAAHVLSLSPSSEKDDDEVGAGMYSIAAELAADRAAATRIATLALTALRSRRCD